MHLSRRSLLAGSTLLLAACSAESSPIQSQSPAPDAPDAPESWQTEIGLIALYAAVRTAYPALDDLLAEIAAQHDEHLLALGGTPQVVEAPPLASTPGGALEQCMVAEAQAANAHQAACLTSDPTLARLLTLLSASEASHVPALRAMQ